MPTDQRNAPEVRVAQGAVEALIELGVDMSACAGLYGLSLADLGRPLPAAVARGVLDAAIERAGDPFVGLRMGSMVRPELFGAVGLAAMTSPTFAEALRCFSRFKRLASDDRLELVRDRQHVIVRMTSPPAGPHHRQPHHRQYVEGELAFIASFGARMSRPPVRPIVSRFSTVPVDSSLYRDIFRSPLEFGCRHDELVYGEADVRVPLVAWDSELNALAVSRCRASSTARDGDAAIDVRVRAVIEQVLPAGPLSVAEVARRLGVSSRSLQRALHACGSSFQRELEEVRREAARRYLSDHAMTDAEVTYLLGFDHPNSLSRACKRWYGSTPAQMRAGKHE